MAVGICAAGMMAATVTTEGPAGGDVLVVVGSKNPVKIAAVRGAFAAVWPDLTITIEGLDVPSGVCKFITMPHFTSVSLSRVRVTSQHAQQTNG